MTQSPTTSASIFTIGHSNLELADFLAVLVQHGVKALCDVRSRPGSFRFPQFNREPLEAGLERLAIELRKAETARAAADVTERFDTVLDEDGEKIGQLEIGMTNGEDGSRGGRRLSHGVLWEGKELFCRKAAGAASSHQRNESSGL